jgi:hypothetical protein
MSLLDEPLRPETGRAGVSCGQRRRGQRPRVRRRRGGHRPVAASRSPPGGVTRRSGARRPRAPPRRPDGPCHDVRDRLVDTTVLGGGRHDLTSSPACPPHHRSAGSQCSGRNAFVAWRPDDGIACHPPAALNPKPRRADGPPARTPCLARAGGFRRRRAAGAPGVLVSRAGNHARPTAPRCSQTLDSWRLRRHRPNSGRSWRPVVY